MKNKKGGLQAVLIVGGLGTRLLPVTKEIPKPMIEICGKPFLEYKINQIKSQGIEEFVLCTGYLGKMIEEYFENGSKFGVNIQYSREEEPLGTAGAIKNAEPLINTNPFIVMNGDTYDNIQLRNLIDFHYGHEFAVTMAITKATNPKEQELVEAYNQVITKFYKRGTLEHKSFLKENLNAKTNAGTYVFDKVVFKILKYLKALLSPRKEKMSLEQDFFPYGIEAIGAYEYRGYMKDLANFQFCEEFRRDFLRGMINDN